MGRHTVIWGLLGVQPAFDQWLWKHSWHQMLQEILVSPLKGPETSFGLRSGQSVADPTEQTLQKNHIHFSNPTEPNLASGSMTVSASKRQYPAFKWLIRLPVCLQKWRDGQRHSTAHLLSCIGPVRSAQNVIHWIWKWSLISTKERKK